jgi:hypothetical protein
LTRLARLTEIKSLCFRAVNLARREECKWAALDEALRKPSKSLERINAPQTAEQVRLQGGDSPVPSLTARDSIERRIQFD